MRIKSFITYEGPPISSGGAHQLGSKSPEFIYNNILEFIKSYTDDSGADAAHFELIKFRFKNVIKYSLKFGIPKFDWNNFLSNGHKIVRWKVSNKEIDYYINNFSNLECLRLCILWRFQFVDMVTKEVLPGQTLIPVIDFRQHNSQLYLRLSHVKSTASVWFAFPFEDLTGEHLNYINSVQKALPFKFSKQSWRLWKLSKNHNWMPQKLSL